MIRAVLVAMPVLVVLVACTDASSPSPDVGVSPPRMVLPAETVTMTVAQRSTTPIDGSNGNVRLTIDDITRGQVLASISTSEGESVLSPVSMKPGESSAFKVDGHPFSLSLDMLQNRLIGTDHAVFTLIGPSLTEDAKIRLLIDRLRNLKGASFIRNGSVHGAAKAAEHLETKWNYAKDEIDSASEFIDEIASRSSMTGNAYRIRFSNGTETNARTYLEGELEKVERSRAR
jgi:hypothetical protein